MMIKGLQKIVWGLGLLLVSGTVYGQQEIIVGSAEYQQAKLNGTLDQYTLVYTLDAFQPIQNQKKKPLPNSGKPKSGNCDCYVEPDGTYTEAIPPNDDGSSALITIPFNFNFYGQTYTNLYINNNGNITFDNPMATFSPTAFPSTGPKIIAPFWGDVDTRAGNGEVVYKITPTAIYVNWEEVGYYNQHGDLLNTFQLIISDGTDPAIPDGNNVAFCYQDMQWTTGDASNGVGGFPGPNTPYYYATCGTNKGDNISFFQLAQFGHPGTDFDGAMGNDDGISWLDYKSFFIDVSDATNIPPIPEGVAACDTFKVCAFGDTADISINFFAPEAGQTTTITWSDGGLTSLEEIANISGNTAQLVLRVIGNPADAGTYTINVTASDDYSPTPGVTSMDFVIVIQDDPNFTLDPVLDFTPACDSIEVSVLNGPYDTYLWDNLSNDPSTYITDSGNFGVTVSLNQCYKRVDSMIVVPKPVNFDLVGNLYLCPGEDSTYIELGDSSLFGSVDWNLGDLALDTLNANWLTPGTYTIVNTDTTGLCTNDTTFTIGQGVSATLFNDTTACFGLDFQSQGVTLGTGSVWSSPDPEISFSSTTVANPVITATDYGFYTVYLTTPCANDLEAEIVFPAPPSIFSDTTVCGDQFQVPVDSIYSFAGGTWSLLVPSSGTFTPSNTVADPLLTATNVPYQFQLTYTDNYCPNLSDNATVLMIPLPSIDMPDVSCNMSEFAITSNSYQGGIWSLVDGPGILSVENGQNPNDTLLNGTQVSDPDVQATEHGTYTVSFTDNFCGVTVTDELYFPPYIWTQVNDTTLCTGVVYPLDAWISPYNVSYSWSTGATGPTINVSEPGVYTVTITNECYSFSDDAVIDYYVCDIEAPNVISLSSMSGNNVWFVNSDGIAEFECVIVNRWGNTVYEYNDVNGFWNGRDKSGNAVEEGTYFYRIKAKAYGGEELEKQGFIQVIH